MLDAIDTGVKWAMTNNNVIGKAHEAKRVSSYLN